VLEGRVQVVKIGCRLCGRIEFWRVIGIQQLRVQKFGFVEILEGDCALEFGWGTTHHFRIQFFNVTGGKGPEVRSNILQMQNKSLEEKKQFPERGGGGFPRRWWFIVHLSN
jgi:hypothetical protein